MSLSPGWACSQVLFPQEREEAWCPQPGLKVCGAQQGHEGQQQIKGSRAQFGAMSLSTGSPGAGSRRRFPGGQRCAQDGSHRPRVAGRAAAAPGSLASPGDDSRGCTSHTWSRRVARGSHLVTASGLGSHLVTASGLGSQDRGKSQWKQPMDRVPGWGEGRRMGAPDPVPEGSPACKSSVVPGCRGFSSALGRGERSDQGFSLGHEAPQPGPAGGSHSLPRPLQRLQFQEREEKVPLMG